MKTAMQELIEWMEVTSLVIPFPQEDAYQKAKELLIKEREQIIESYYQGNLSGEKFMWGVVRLHPEEYYDKNYNNESNT